MDVSETLALEFLRYLGMAEIIYEPDGNVPPDFSCAGKVAVEVRRLNQHDALVRGLEEVAIPLVTKIRALLASLGPPQEASWFVTFRYRRPVEAWAALRPKITSALLCFRNNPSEGVVRLPVSDRFELGLAKSSQLLATCFVLGGYSDHDSGGWTASEIIRNLAIVIPEKVEEGRTFPEEIRRVVVGLARPYRIRTARYPRVGCTERTCQAAARVDKDFPCQSTCAAAWD